MVNRSSRFKVSVLQSGRSGGDLDLNLVSQFMLETTLAERPTLLEGIPTPIRVKVSNQSTQDSDLGTLARMTVDSENIEIRKSEASVGVVPAGESRVVEFVVVARQASDQIRLPIAVETLLGTGRRVGLIDQTLALPVLNDYQIHLDTDMSLLSQPGVTRIEYKIKNKNSRVLNRGLQLSIRIRGADEKEFQVLGPNPQYIKPLQNGETTQFVFPVLVKSANKQGMLELEVKENGRLVVIHQRSF